MAPRRWTGGRNILCLFVNGEKANDFELFFAGGGKHLDLVADLAIKKRAADGGGGGDQSLFDVGFLDAYELVLNFQVFLDVHHDNTRAVAGTVFWNVGEVEHAEITHALFEVADFGVYVALALFGVLVLGVFGEVAVRAGNGNFLGEVDVEFMLQGINFLLELLFNIGKRVGHSFPRQRKMMRNPARPDSARNIIDGGEFSRQEGKEGFAGEECINGLIFKYLDRAKRFHRTGSSTLWDTVFPAASLMVSV